MRTANAHTSLSAHSDQPHNCFTFYKLFFVSSGSQAGVKGFEPPHEISNNVGCATSKASDQPAHTRSLIRAFASCLNIL